MSFVKIQPFKTGLLAALLFAGNIAPADAHSWVEQVQRIAPNGTFVGDPGYPRGKIFRTGGNNPDDQVHLLPPNDRPEPKILPDDKIAKFEREEDPTDSPRIKAAPGELLALRYLENGHVSMPNVPENKPANRGTVFIYGTDKPSPDDKLLDIHHVWNKDGSGGDKRGKLIATRNYDDGQCREANPSEISTQRDKEFPKTADELQGANLWCQVDVRIPEDVDKSSYTMYWVWDWPTLTPELAQKSKDGVYPTQGEGVVKPEVYTSTVDIDIVAADADLTVAAAQKNNGVPGIALPGVSFVEKQDINNAAVKDQMSDMFLVNPSQGGDEPVDGGEENTAAPGAGPESSAPAVPAFPSARPENSPPGAPASPSASPESPAPGIPGAGPESSATASPSIPSSGPESSAPTATEATSITGAPEDGPKTVTVTVSLEPTTLYTIITRLPGSDDAAPTPTPSAEEAPTGPVSEPAPSAEEGPAGPVSEPAVRPRRRRFGYF